MQNYGEGNLESDYRAVLRGQRLRVQNGWYS